MPSDGKDDMSRGTPVGVLVCIVVLTTAMLAVVAGAPASAGSIKSLVTSYDGKIITSEGKLLTAIGDYKSTQNAAPVLTALDNAIGVLRSLKSKIAKQSATAARVKKGKADLEKGLQAVIVAYEHLKSAFSEKAASPSEAKEDAEKADTAVKKGRADLAAGLQLLKR
jgi:hypothetical protein